MFIDKWEYSKWVQTIGRSLRINPPTGAELTAAQNFFTYELGRRTWLKPTFYGNSEKLQGLVANDNNQVLGRQIEVIGVDLMKITVMDDAEKTAIDTLMTATASRRYGNQGGGCGADVHLRGMQGNRGPQGSAGNQGATGAQGAQGLQGAQGAQGGLGLLGNLGNPGVAGLPGALGSLGNLGTIGDLGTQGAQGAQGAQGIQGATGEAGARGAQGPQGT